MLMQVHAYVLQGIALFWCHTNDSS